MQDYLADIENQLKYNGIEAMLDAAYKAIEDAKEKRTTELYKQILKWADEYGIEKVIDVVIKPHLDKQGEGK